MTATTPELSERQLLVCALRRLRRERGLSLHETARLFGLHVSQLSRAENGHRRPPPAGQLAAAFRISRAAALELCPQCAYHPPAGYQCLRCGTPGGAA
jgi:transcriptional regulator with XRE-family HTH domain